MTPTTPRPDDLDALLGLKPLAVGDRVRVRLSGECRGYVSLIQPENIIPHRRTTDDGFEGFVDVMFWRNISDDDAHIYSVRRPDGQNRGCFARAELSRLEDT